MGAGAVQKTNVFQQPEDGIANGRRRSWEMSYVDARAHSGLHERFRRPQRTRLKLTSRDWWQGLDQFNLRTQFLAVRLVPNVGQKIGFSTDV